MKVLGKNFNGGAFKLRLRAWAFQIGLMGWGLVLQAIGSTPTVDFTQLKSQLQSQNQRVHLPKLPATASEIEKLSSEAISRFQGALEQIRAIVPLDRSFNNTVRAFDDQLAQFHEIYSSVLATTYFNVGTQAYEAALQATLRMEKFENSLFYDLQNRAMFENFAGAMGAVSLPPTEKALLEQLLLYFEKVQKGVKLQVDALEVEGQRQQLAEMEGKYSRLLSSQNNSHLRFLEKQLRGFDPTLMGQLAKEGRFFLLDPRVYWQFDQVMKFVHDRSVRQKVFEARVGQGGGELQVQAALLGEMRRRLAKKLGHPSWMAYQLDDMSLTPAVLSRHLSQLVSQSESSFQTEKQVIEKHRKQNQIEEVKIYDIKYLFQQELLARGGMGEREMVKYFPLRRVLDALFEYVSRWLGVEIQKVEGLDLWHPEVETYVVTQKESGEILGLVSWDLFPRAGKDEWFFMHSLGGARKTQETRIRPHVMIVGNYAQDEEGMSLLHLEDASTLWHEFGHALQAVFDQSEYHLLGNDFGSSETVEFPSRLLERLFFEPEVLAWVSEHHETGQSLDVEEARALLQEEKLGYVHRIRENLAQATLDIQFHLGKTKNIEKLSRHIYQKIYYPFETPFHFAQSLGYIVGYDGLFWTYLWADAYAYQFISEMKSQGGELLQAPKGGEKLIEGFLSQGARVGGKEVLKRTLEKPFSFCQNALLFYTSPLN